MRVLYYTHPALFEPALCLVRELSRRIAVDLVLELSAGAWKIAGFDAGERTLPAGLIPGDDVLRDAFPAGVRAYWQSAASFQLAVHPSRRSFHPRSWAVSRSVLRFARTSRADVLHLDDVDISPRMALALPGAALPPTVITAHDPEPHSGESNWRKTVARRLAYPRASRFILYNASLRDLFARRHHLDPGVVDVTKLGVYDVLREWAPGPPHRDDARPVVLFFGRLSAYKGLDVFYDAARIVSERLPAVRFMVAGRPVAGFTPPAAPALPEPGAIAVRDEYLSTRETAELFQRATLVVCPYRDATQSGVILTAFAFGVPAVASDVGGLPEYVIPERTGLLVPPGDPRALADAIVRVVKDEALLAHLRQGVSDARTDFLSWRHAAEVVVESYERAAADRQR